MHLNFVYSSPHVTDQRLSPLYAILLYSYVKYNTCTQLFIYIIYIPILVRGISETIDVHPHYFFLKPISGIHLYT